MSKQTAVQLLVSKLNKEGFAPVLTNEEIQEALQMERDQIIEAYTANSVIRIRTKAEQYYEQTYGGQDERNN